MKQLFAVLAGVMLIGSAWAQSSPATANAAPAAANATAAGSAANDLDNMSVTAAHSADATAGSACNNTASGKTHVHGDASTGVAAGSHGASGTYNAGDVRITRQSDSCESTKGDLSISVGGSVEKDSLPHHGGW